MSAEQIVSSTTVSRELYGDLKPVQERTPLLRCALEYMSAHDRAVLREPSARMDVIALDLLLTSRELMQTPDFRKVIMELGWHSIISCGTARPSPLTMDLVTRPTPAEERQPAWPGRALRDFIADKDGLVTKIIANRIDALVDQMSNGTLADMKDQQHLALLQLSEAAMRYKMSSLRQPNSELKDHNALDIAIHSIVELSKRMEKEFPAELMAHSTEILSTVLTHRLAHLQLAGIIDDNSKISRAIQNRLERYGADATVFDVTNEVRAAASLAKADSYPNMHDDIRALVPAAVADTVCALADQSERAAVAHWINENREALEIKYINLLIEAVFMLSKTPQQFIPAVKAAKIGTERAKMLAAAALPEAWCPSDALYIHQREHLPPRLLEAAAISKAERITVLGSVLQPSENIDQDARDLLQKILMLAKTDPRLSRITSLAKCFATGEEFIQAELDGTGVSCQGSYLSENPPKDIWELERKTRGTAAWAVDQRGHIKYVLIFDGTHAPSDLEWSSTKLANGIIRALPKRDMQVIPVESDANVERHADTNKEKPKKDGSLPAQAAHIPPTPTHVLPETVRVELAVWLEMADQMRLFEGDPTFSGSSDGQALPQALRRAAQGQALNAKTSRAIRRLPSLLTDKKHQPVLSNTSLHELRAELANILERLK